MNQLHEIIRALLESVDRRYDMLEERYSKRNREMEKRLDIIENRYEEEVYRLNQEIQVLNERIHDIETQLLLMQNSNTKSNPNHKRF